MRKLGRGLVLALLGLLLFASPALAIGNPTYISIGDVYVFRSLIETGDQLYFVRYDVSYGSIPDEDAEDTWLMSIYDTDGVTLLYTRPLNFYQHNIISIYLTSAQALTWEGAYVIHITGNPAVFDTLVEGVNFEKRTLAPGDYYEGTLLGGVMLTQAQILEDDWGITLLSSGGLLNTTGSTYFRKAVPNLNTIVTEIFQITTAYYTEERTNWSRAYAEGLHQHTGPNLTAAITDIGNFFGVSYGWASFWASGLGFLMLAGAFYGITRNPGVSVTMAFPVLLGVAWIGLGTAALELALIIVFVVGVIFGVYFILGRFA